VKIFYAIGLIGVIAVSVFFIRVTHILSGEAQGTTYHITVSRPLWVFPSRIDAAVTKALEDLDKVASGYRPDSEVSHFNNAKPGDAIPVSATMRRLLETSAFVFAESGGAFDPSAGALFELWDFRKPGWQAPDAATVRVTLTKIQKSSLFSLSESGARDSEVLQGEPEGNPRRGAVLGNKYTPSLGKGLGDGRIVFDAIAQGLSVDLIAESLESLGILRYFVEVGGELRVRNGKPWKIGISYPEVGADAWSLYGILRLKDGSVATSGTYRRVVLDNKGVTRSHIIDPRTGYPATHDVVSATVIHPDCGMADALATAVLVLGEKDGLALLDRIPGASGFVIVHRDGVYTPYYSALFPVGDFEVRDSVSK
jgi:thiamine biosynthesis lipoprotein